MLQLFVTCALAEWFQKRAVIRVIPGSFIYEVGLEDMKDLGSGRREEGERRLEDKTSPGRWKGPHSRLHAKLHEAKSSTSRTLWHFRESCFYFLTENLEHVLERTLYCESGNQRKMVTSQPLLSSVSIKQEVETKRSLMPSFHLKFCNSVPKTVRHRFYFYNKPY